MLNPIIVNSRELLRNQKKIFANVNATHKPAIIVNRKQKLVAVISLDSFDKLEQLTNLKNTRSLLNLAEVVEKHPIKGPKDLSTNLNKYAWGKSFHK